MIYNNKKDHIIKIVLMILLIIILLLSASILSLKLLGIKFNYEKEKKEYNEMGSIVSNTTAWDYLDGGNESGVGNVWTTPDFESTDIWKKAKGDFSNNQSLKPITLLKGNSKLMNKSTTFFFRHEFYLDDSSIYRSLNGKISYTGAVIVYLNGNIIFEGNVPEGGYLSNLESKVSEKRDKISNYDINVTDLSSLIDGKNVISVELHTSNDLKDNSYFSMPYLNLSNIKTSEIVPNTDTLVIEQDKSMTDFIVSFKTKSDDYYMVEYIEKEKYKKDSKYLKENSIKKIMGRKSIKNEVEFLHYVTLSGLKNNTKYLYHIVPVGQVKGSEYLEFTTTRKNNFSFAIVGENSNIKEETDASIQRRVLLDLEKEIGNVNLIFYQDNQIENLMKITENKLLKKVPTGFYEAIKFEGLKNEAFTYQDVLFIKINEKLSKQDLKSYLNSKLNQYQQKWKVLFLSANDLNYNDYKSYFEIFSNLKIDICFINSDINKPFDYKALKSKYSKELPTIFLTEDDIRDKVLKIDVNQDQLKKTIVYAN